MSDDTSASALDGLAQELFEGCPAPTLIVDREARLLHANRAARGLFGREVPLLATHGEALRCLQSIGPGGCGRQEACQSCVIRGSVQRAVASGTVHRCRAFLRVARASSGPEEICVLVSTAPIQHEGKTRVVLTLEKVGDVHLKEEVLRTEAALHQAHEQALSLARFPESNPDPVMRIGADGALGYANAAALSTLSGLGLRLGQPVPSSLAGPAGRALELGQRVWAEVSCAGRVFALSACPVGTEVNVYGSDVTERKRAAEELAAERERLAVTLASIGDGVIATDENGRIRLLNGVAEELTGWGAAEAVGRSIEEVFHIVSEETRQPVESPVARAMREGVVVGLANHTALLRRDGSERPIADSAAPIRDASGRSTGVVLVFRDQTEERRAELALREADRRKEEFLGILSHELRNPLAAIRSGLELLDGAAPGGEQGARARAVLGRQVGQLGRLIDDLLDATRISHGKIALERAVVDASQIVRQTCDDFRAAFAERGVGLELERSPGQAWIDADATRVAQVVGNLLQNAAKFTARGGTTAVSVEVEEGRVAIRVRDDGVGIDPAAIDRMFEPFVQAERSLARTQGGLGLGLSLVKGLVELHGGSVQARSPGRGRGSEFTVLLPQAEAPVQRPAVRRQPGQQRARTVLIVEDNPDAGQTLADLLRLRGHQVHVAADGRSGIAAARELRPEVIFCDIGLPDMDGCELARALRADPRLTATRLVALSGYAREQDRLRAARAGFDTHLPKPAAIEELLEVLSGAPGEPPG